ncbi:hypothetical protein HHI36_018738 [Cryptolaemus montrouzieri]|uniref:Uncharacterized protein n=1 Tax=Cryptolaemus montrouzieri TaxID=559131 RepID=A0ABD2P0T7_9CUCU
MQKNTNNCQFGFPSGLCTTEAINKLLSRIVNCFHEEEILHCIPLWNTAQALVLRFCLRSDEILPHRQIVMCLYRPGSLQVAASGEWNPPRICFEASPFPSLYKVLGFYDGLRDLTLHTDNTTLSERGGDLEVVREGSRDADSKVADWFTTK